MKSTIFKGKRCFKCQGIRHIAFECPNHNIVSLMEEEIDDPNSDKHLYEPIDEGQNSEGDMELIQLDQGLLIVVQRALKFICDREEEN